MKRCAFLLFAVLCFSGVAHAAVNPSSLGYCNNPSGVWIPIYAAINGVSTSGGPGVNLFGLNNGSPYPLTCDSSGHLIPGGPCGGDLSGTQPICTVTGINGTPVPGLTGNGSNGINVAGVVAAIAGVTNNGQELGTATPLQPLYSAPSLAPRLLMVSGDSTTGNAIGAIKSLCDRSGVGQEMAGIQCAPNSTYSIDGSNNVTVVVSGTLPSNCVSGVYVSFDASGTFASNALGNSVSNSTFLIASTPTTSSLTFYNSMSAGATSSTAANGVLTCSVVNNGSNGQTQNGYNTASGQGSLAFAESLCPDLDIHGMGINDVRQGATTLAQLEGYYGTYVTSFRASCPKTAIELYSENSLLADDLSGNGWVTSPSTASSTAVASAGSQTITLAANLTAISGLVTPGLSLAQEVANTQAVTVTPTTGGCTSGSTALSLTSGANFPNGMMITIAGASASAGTLTAQIQTGGLTNSVTIFPQCGTTVSGAAVAQSATVYSGHLLVDTGSSGEIVPITAISGSTVTATFALTHTSGFTVIPTMGTMAQAYSNLIHDAAMSFEGLYPNVQVADNQSFVFGRLVADSSTNMQNQLHPSNNVGYYSRSIFLSSVLNRDNLLGTGHATVANATTPTVPYGSVSQYSQNLSTAAIAANYSACWSNGYYQCVEDQRYYSSVCEGVLNGYASNSYLRINGETLGQSLGVCQSLPGDVVEILGYGDLALPSNATSSPTSTYTQINNPGVIPWTIIGNPVVRVQRPSYVSSTDEQYARSPNYYTLHHKISTQACGTNFCRFFYDDLDPNGQPYIMQGGNWTTSDTAVFPGGTLSLATVCSSWIAFTATGVQCTGTGNWAAYSNLTGKLYGTEAMETPVNGSINQIAANYVAGSCAMGGGTSCTVTLLHGYVTPLCYITKQSATAVVGGWGCTVSGKVATITADTANSLTWAALVIGNPN